MEANRERQHKYEQVVKDALTSLPNIPSLWRFRTAITCLNQLCVCWHVQRMTIQLVVAVLVASNNVCLH